MLSREIDPMIFVEAHGEVSLEGVEQGFVKEVLPAIAESKVTKVLMDGTRIKGQPANDFERVLYREFGANAVREFTRKHGIVPRFAYVIHEPIRDPRHFGETVAVNRGMFVKVFDTHAEAISWLHDPEAKP